MRTRLVFATTLLFGTLTAGCFDFLSDSKSFDQDTSGAGGTAGTGGTGGTAGTSGTSGSGTGGTTTTPEAECTPSLTSDAIDATCGLFVSPNGDDATGDGTKEAPYATLGKALASLTDKKTIYACADEAKPYDEAVDVDAAGVFLFGGLDCAAWTFTSGTRTPWTAPQGSVPLTIRAGGSIHIEDFAITAQDALPLDNGTFGAGKSSIAIVAQAASTLELTRVDVAAGKGSAGSAGEPPTGMAAKGDDGKSGNGGCDSAQGEFGGVGGQNMCGDVDVSGGAGGQGLVASLGGSGTAGQPGGATGAGGLALGGGITCDTNGAGGNGFSPLEAEAGKGATTDALGALTAEGFAGVRGGEGVLGTPGQGGGGGGGAQKCASDTTKAGPSGGGGGAGGCGGAGGKGGYGGGASIAIASLGATLALADVILTASSGGAGGTGASGQDGGPGGAAGMPGPADGAVFACGGGKGGTGGKGGRGGGGRGGHSIGIAYTGDAPDVTGATITFGSPGDGGMGLGDNAGAEGVAIETQSF